MSNEQKPVWQWIAQHEFRPPAMPTVLAIKRWWQSLTTHLSTAEQTPPAAEETSPSIRTLDAAAAVEALDERLQDWLADSQQQHVQWIICPPHSPAKEAAKEWVQQHQLSLLKPPARDELILNSLSAEIEAPNKVWFLPELGHSFLRQSKGLRWVQAFLAKALAGELGKGVVICDSWAWAFLQQLWPLQSLSAITLAPVTEDGLQTLGLDKGEQQLKHLAGLARGNPGIAWAYATSRYRGHISQHQSAFEMPSMPAQTNDNTAFILHALLLHDGLNRYQLQQLLPIISSTQLEVEQQSLLQAGLIEEHESNWRVSARGYPVVRAALVSRGLWPDQF